jgi:hypothetical protein
VINSETEGPLRDVNTLAELKEGSSGLRTSNDWPERAVVVDRSHSEPTAGTSLLDSDQGIGEEPHGCAEVVIPRLGPCPRNVNLITENLVSRTAHLSIS